MWHKRSNKLVLLAAMTAFLGGWNISLYGKGRSYRVRRADGIRN